MYNTIKSRNHMASYEGFPSAVAVHVHNALMRYPNAISTLASNGSISGELWLTLWGPKRPSVSLAKSLVSRDLNAALRKHVIEKETRSTVLGEFVKYNELTKDEQLHLIAAGTAQEALLAAPWLASDLRVAMVLKVGGEALLQQIAVLPVDNYSDDFVSSHIIANMTEYAHKPSKGISRNLKLIFGRRPEVINKVMPYAKRNVLTAMAGSANITENMCEKLINYQTGVVSLSQEEVRENTYMYQALVANPRTPLHVVQAMTKAASGNGDLYRSIHKRGTNVHVSGRYEDVSDPAALDRLLSRACESRGRDFYSAPRPIELLALSANPHLSAVQRAKVTESINILDLDILSGDPVSALPAKSVSSYSSTYAVPEYDLAARVLGDTKIYWEVLVSMLEDYQGSFLELIETAQTL